MEVNIKNNQSNHQRLSAITVISTSDQIFFISKDIIGFLYIMIHLTSQVWLGICSGMFYPLYIPPRLNPWNIGIQ